MSEYGDYFKNDYAHEIADRPLTGDVHDSVCSWNVEDSSQLDTYTFMKSISNEEQKIIDHKSGFAWVGTSEKYMEIKFVEGTFPNKDLQDLNDWLSDLIIFSPRFRVKKEMDNYYNDDDTSGCSLCKILYGKYGKESIAETTDTNGDFPTCSNCPFMLRCRNNIMTKLYAIE